MGIEDHGEPLENVRILPHRGELDLDKIKGPSLTNAPKFISQRVGGIRHIIERLTAKQKRKEILNKSRPSLHDDNFLAILLQRAVIGKGLLGKAGERDLVGAGKVLDDIEDAYLAALGEGKGKERGEDEDVHEHITSSKTLRVSRAHLSQVKSFALSRPFSLHLFLETSSVRRSLIP